MVCAASTRARGAIRARLLLPVLCALLANGLQFGCAFAAAAPRSSREFKIGGGGGGGSSSSSSSSNNNNNQTKKVIILHDAHEGSHATCEALAHLCVRTDCSESHDALYHNKTIDWPTIDASDAEVFLTRFYPPQQSLEPWTQFSVLMLVRRDLMAWTLGVFHGSNPHERKGQVGELIHFNVSVVRRTAKRKVDGWRRKVDALERLVNNGGEDRIDVHIYFYESFLQDGLNYLRRVAAAAGLGSDFEGGDCVDRFRKDMKRTHSGEPCATRFGTASNCDELTAFFQSSEVPTWDALAGDRFGHLAVA